MYILFICVLHNLRTLVCWGFDDKSSLGKNATALTNTLNLNGKTIGFWLKHLRLAVPPLHRWRHPHSPFSPIGSFMRCAKFQIFPIGGFRDVMLNFFAWNPTLLQNHVTDDVPFLIEIFSLEGRSNPENLSIGQEVDEKNMNRSKKAKKGVEE